MAQFDEYRTTYDAELSAATGFIQPDHTVFAESKANRIAEAAERHLGDVSRVVALDVGCGAGLVDSFLVSRVGELVGVDVSEGILKEAARRNPSVRYCSYPGGELPFDDASFDLVFATAVLHHVHGGDRPAFLRELRRVARPEGLIVVVEHNPLNPFSRLVVRRCVFDRDVALLRPKEVGALFEAAGIRLAERRFITFFPWRGRLFDRAERRLGSLPLGAQYLVAGLAP